MFYRNDAFNVNPFNRFDAACDGNSDTTETKAVGFQSDSTIPCNINNNLYAAGPNKKVEDMIIDMNRKLDDIQNKLKNLTQKENNGKG